VITVNRHPSRSQLRSFSRVWLPLVGSSSAAILWWRGHASAALVMCAIVALATVLALASEAMARWLFVGLSFATYPIGWVVSLAALAIVYFLVVTPIALAMRLSGRDRLRLKWRGDESGWIERRGRDSDAERAFRQF
jgi:hypothetical protein